VKIDPALGSRFRAREEMEEVRGKNAMGGAVKWIILSEDMGVREHGPV